MLKVVIAALIIAGILGISILLFSQDIFNPCPPDSYVISKDIMLSAQNAVIGKIMSQQIAFYSSPQKYSINRCRATWISAGIKNSAEDNQSHLFSINVIPMTGDVSWLTFDNGQINIMSQSIGFSSITVKIPQNAIPGTYSFKIVACKDVSDHCSLQNSNWGAPQDLELTVIK